MSQGRVQRSRLLGRQTECEALDRLLTDALAGESRVIVLRGEAGVGKSALLQHLSDWAACWHVATARAYLCPACGPDLVGEDLRPPLRRRSADLELAGDSQ
jgi:hypothetical protein